jgi:hypothetical protein
LGKWEKNLKTRTILSASLRCFEELDWTEDLTPETTTREYEAEDPDEDENAESR